MAATFIPALVIKHNNDVYQNEDLVVGVTMAIPTPGAGGVIEGDYWADPINDNGIVDGFNFYPTTPDAPISEAPSDQSFHVFRLTREKGNDVWYVRGTTSNNTSESPVENGYIEASADAECCDATPRTLPTDVPELFPCQTSCVLDGGDYYFIIQIPLPRPGATWTGNGYLNGTALPEITGATPALLATTLNTNWTNVGSPNVAITWTATANGTLKGLVTDGDGSEVLCAKFE
jgi:hypothetical protein